MKLLVCTTEYYPYGSGIANVAYNVVQQLEKKGVECTVCSPTGPDITIESVSGYGRLSLVHYWYKVSKYFQNRQDQYDIAWLHYPLMLRSNPFKRSYVTIHSTAHGIQYPLYLKPYQIISEALERYCLDKLGANIPFSSVSDQSMLDLRANGFDKENIVKIINGVDTGLFGSNYEKNELRARHGLPIGSTIFLSVGRLTYHKMPFRMIDLFKRIQNYDNDYLLVVVGAGKLLPELEAYAKKNGVRVKFLGYVKSEELPEIYSCADFFFMTSKYEGGEPTLTVAEAMASGLPCIASQIPNFKLVEENNLGLLFHPSNDDIAESEILNYLSNYDPEFSKEIQNYARKNFDWEVISNKYFEEFCNAISNDLQYERNPSVSPQYR
ncbi:glycosyltransferase family 4 protein [Methanoculleus sp.]|jgi:glycosyltransferase involved in cell wall biosynthesis|uniref:glycosyltransferase family 4 protein n=1 Tax=Methanoculleus sp. TaxID=90427 RepID=UPI001BD4FE61|nr:glycosyltransferase family 4 protein [Methanoculleus sp.]